MTAKASYYVYKCPDAPLDQLEISERKEVTYKEGFSFKTGRCYGNIFVKEHKGKFSLMSRVPFWNAWGWSDWVAPELEALLRKDLGL